MLERDFENEGNSCSQSNQEEDITEYGYRYPYEYSSLRICIRLSVYTAVK